jgi:cytochrome b pre-mRNA-processing protein 3
MLSIGRPRGEKEAGELPHRREPAKQAAASVRALYDSAVAQSRAPVLYSTIGVPDTVEGRFEILTLHIVFILDRLGTNGEQGRGLAQALFDSFVSNLDGAMREMGVSDLSMGKRMRQLGSVFYGRAEAYRAALAALPDEGPLRQALERTVLWEIPEADGEALASYAARCAVMLAQAEPVDLSRGALHWPSP